jgi:hypothetical protein
VRRLEVEEHPFARRWAGTLAGLGERNQEGEQVSGLAPGCSPGMAVWRMTGLRVSIATAGAVSFDEGGGAPPCRDGRRTQARRASEGKPRTQRAGKHPPVLVPSPVLHVSRCKGKEKGGPFARGSHRSKFVQVFR